MASLLDNLMNKRIANKKGNGRLVFMALKPEIEEALDAGFLVIDIYRELVEQKKISIHYVTFSTYVKKYIRQNKPIHEQDEYIKKTGYTRKEEQLSPPSHKQKQPQTNKKFQHNPDPSPIKRMLIRADKDNDSEEPI